MDWKRISSVVVKDPTQEIKNFFYPPESRAGVLEREMHKAKVPHIGVVDHLYKKYGLENKMCFSMEISKMERLVRSRALLLLGESQMIRVHEWESETGLQIEHQWWGMLGLRRPQYDFSDSETIKDWVRQSMPAYDKTFLNLPVPPFFLLDCTFDPIEFHHQWDRNFKSQFASPTSRPVAGED